MSYHLRRYKHSRYWYARITTPDGKRGNWKSTRKTSRREAEAVGRQWDAAATSGHTLVTLTRAFQELALHMGRKRRGKGVAPATMEVLRLKASHVTSAFGRERDISTIKLADTEAYLDHRRSQGRHDATISKELGYLVAALKRCFKLGLYSGNYEALWPDTLGKQFDGRTRWLTGDEYVALVEHIAPQWRDHVIVYVNTGVRFAELYTLRAFDVRNDILHIRGTKTDGAKRKVPLSAEALQVLKRRVQATTDGVLFEASENMGNQKRAWLRALRSACKRANIPHASTNDLRRTFASWCWHQNVDKDALIRWMGHSSSKMIDSVYAQPSSAHYRDEIAKFPSRLVSPVSPQNPQNPQTLAN